MKGEAVVELVCCLCGVVIRGSGNNARPVGPGRCCDECNRRIVEPHRLNPPEDTAEEHSEWLAGVEKTLDDLVGDYSDLVWLFSRGDFRGKGTPAFEQRIRKAYPELIEAAMKDPAAWLHRFEGMLAAFKLAHGLVARGEDEDIAKDTFPNWEP